MAFGFQAVRGPAYVLAGCRRSEFHFHRCAMWNYSAAPHSLLLQYGDDYGTFLVLLPSCNPLGRVSLWMECSLVIVAFLRCVQPGARALVHRQDPWAWTGCEFYLPCRCTGFVRELVFFLFHRWTFSSCAISSN